MYLLSNYIPIKILGAEDTAMNKTEETISTLVEFMDSTFILAHIFAYVQIYQVKGNGQCQESGTSDYVKAEESHFN